VVASRSQSWIYGSFLNLWPYTWCDPKVPEIWILSANGYEYIKMPIRVSPTHSHSHTHRHTRAHTSWICVVSGIKLSGWVYCWWMYFHCCVSVSLRFCESCSERAVCLYEVLF
jgi:hypothetical protein